MYAPQWSLDSLASSLAMQVSARRATPPERSISCWLPPLPPLPNPRSTLFPYRGASLSLYRAQKENPAYKAFVEGRPVPEEDPLVPSSTSSPHPAPTVVGTWDDHDFGINDGGGSGSLTKYGVTDAAQRAQLFQDFLATPATSPARKRHGVYSSHQYGQGEKEVKVILLDTRSHRALHAIPSIGSVSKYAPVVGGLFGLLGALSRGLAAWAGLANQAQDTMLDAEQWKWLEDQLANSSARAHIIVSSIQVLTANPVVESWAHFPAERNRLLHLLNKHSPKGLLLLSGDVHMAELMSGTASDEVVEVTSSGLTHTCSSGLVPGAVCDAVVAAFSGSRYRAGPAYHPGRNFATVDFDWSSTDGCAGPTRSEEGGASDAPGISVTIHDVDTGRAVLSYSRPACAGPVTVAAPGVLWTGWRAAGVRACIAALCMALLVAAFKGARRRQRLPRARVGRGTADSKGR